MANEKTKKGTKKATKTKTKKPASQESPKKEQPKARAIQWLKVLFSNGDRFKIPAKLIARRMVELKQVEYDEVIYDAKKLIDFANEFMSWAELKLDAHKYIIDKIVDYNEEWITCDKLVTYSPVDPTDKPVDPNKTPDYISVKQAEDEELGDFGGGTEGEVVDLD